ncbi:hypothetical protein L7F22_046128 [Adiantum nelumboides]|nr:hypothetical protein [Adiantum nelumboides]
MLASAPIRPALMAGCFRRIRQRWRGPFRLRQQCTAAVGCVRGGVSTKGCGGYAAPSAENANAVCHSTGVCNSLIYGGPGCATSCDAPPSPVCFNNSCSTFISNSAISTSTGGLVWIDTFFVLSIDGPSSALIEVPKLAFVCGDDLLLKNNVVPSGVVGEAGLSRALLALPSQLAAKRSLKRIFTYCLPNTGNGKGILIFGESPIVFQPNNDFTNSLRYTPLLKDTKERDSYIIGVKLIAVNEVTLSIDSNLLKIKNDGTESSKAGNNNQHNCERRREFETRAIVLGTFQQHDALLQYDLATSRLGFVSTLLGRMATCSNFNFTSSS